MSFLKLLRSRFSNSVCSKNEVWVDRRTGGSPEAGWPWNHLLLLPPAFSLHFWHLCFGTDAGPHQFIFVRLRLLLWRSFRCLFIILCKPFHSSCMWFLFSLHCSSTFGIVVKAVASGPAWAFCLHKSPTKPMQTKCPKSYQKHAN